MCIRDRDNIESKVVNIESADEDIVGVEFENEVIESVDELERKCIESLQLEGLQRVKFSRGVVVVGEENPSRVYLGDVWSTNNCPLIFCASGGARWCSNKVVLPSAWDGRKRVKWHYDGRYFERELCVDGEIELFKVGRNYKELVERLGIERVENDVEILPCVEADIAAVDDLSLIHI